MQLTNSKLCIFFSLLLLITFYYSPLKAQQEAKLSDNGVGYLEYLPSNYSSNNKLYPAIIFFHGSGERGDGSPSSLEAVKRNGPPKHIENGETMCFDNNGVEECFIVLSPQTNRWSFVGYEMIPFVQYALGQYRIDPDRVYLTGLSMGGEGTWKVAYSPENTSNYFAAIAPIAGRGSYQDACIIADHELPVWAFHGENDGAISLNAGRTPINGMNQCNPDPAPIFTVYEGVGHAGTWQRAYKTDNSLHSPNIYEWFLMHSKTGTTNSSEPAPPSNLSSNFKNSNKIELRWSDNSNNETNFLIERSFNSNSNFSVIKSTSNNTTQFEDTELVPNTQYYYRIRAKNNEGYSSYSNKLSIKTDDQLPNEPQGTIIVDNRNSSVTKIGDWSTSTAGGDNKYETDYLHDGNYVKGSKKITFNVNLSPGTYEVFAWWYAYSNRATNTPFEITSRNGTTTIYKNQRYQNAKWVSLGTYEFSTSAIVNISNNNTNGFVVVDAIKFEPMSSGSTQPNLEVILDNKDYEVNANGDWVASTHGGNSKYEEDYFHDGNEKKGEKSVVFSADVNPGSYEVFARWYAFNNRATNTPFEIKKAGGSETIYKNQQLNNAEWVSLGTYDFNNLAEVIVKNENTDGYVVADAIKLVSSTSSATQKSADLTNLTDGIKETNLDDVAVFPNPAQNMFKINSPFDEIKTFKLTMRNKSGMVQWEQTEKGKDQLRFDIDRSSIDAGIKYLSIEVEGHPIKILQILLL